MIRNYRYKLTTSGQRAPENLIYPVIDEIERIYIEKKKKISIIDIGCGLGSNFKTIKKPNKKRCAAWSVSWA